MIEIDGVSKIYDGKTVVDDVTLTIEPRTITVIVGTSGSGKTTLLRMINRLVELDAGTIRLDGEDNRTIRGYELRRRIGYAIQGHGLFPHQTVAENIGVVPRLIGWGRKRTDDKVRELLSLFQLPPEQFISRYPHELSGGEQQRVGVARALAAEPNVLLMDEPFGALDPIIRSRAQDDLLAIQKHFSTTIILVTHDMNEAFHLADKIAVMDAGRLLQYGTPEELVRNPANGFVEAMIGVSERPFRLLSMGRVAEVVEPGEATGPAIDPGASQQEALAQMLWTGRRAAPVISPEGQVAARITLESIFKRAKGKS
ncbi:ABC transporter ATP-binding protein [Rhizobium halophilum]|uniref:ABC transporter ATP-binding protein n=1 Tax=Rhizobium halophilum TaxID=2846852 RepID=UPI001EFD0B8C|nr:ABC transporter ATP-binding protein [Rhizobium halophilum]MCF6368568.1 ABC transporter ATP-binding protein [Rhizobium halophilum]